MQEQLFSVGKLLGKPREKNVIRMDFIERGTKEEKVLEPADIMPSDGVWCVYVGKQISKLQMDIELKQIRVLI
jgi:hypothetical protein